MGKYGRTYHFENGLSLAVEAKDGPWVVRWTEKAATVGGRPQSKRRSTGTTDLAQAREYLTGFASRRLHENVKAQVITCGDILELYETYLRTHHKHQSNLDVTRKLMRFWRDVPVSEVNVFTQRQYEAERRRGLHSNYRVPRSAPGPISDATLCRDIVGLNAALSWAVKSGVIDSHQPLIPLPNSVPRPPTLTAAEADELMALAAETSVGKPRLTRIHRWVWMAVITGVRCKALEKLQWSQVDWTQGDGWIDFAASSTKVVNSACANASC